jgi:hypothetical protein
MRKKRVIILFATCILIICSVSIFVWNTSKSRQSENNNGALSIVINVDTPNEERALTTAESVYYTAITGKEHIYMRGSEDYKHLGTYISYAYANFIDAEVLKYYQERYDYQQKQTSPKGVTLNYMANVTQLAHVSITNDGDVFVFYDVDNSVALTTAIFWYPVSDTHIFYKNQTGYQKLRSDVNLNFSDCYFVEMTCRYHEYYAPLAAWWAETRQIVILDQNFVPVLICIYAPPPVVA